MWTFIAPIIIALFTGTTYVAYRHPKGYRKIFDSLKPTVISLTLGIIIFQIGGAYGLVSDLYETLKSSPNETLETVNHLITSLNDTRSFLKMMILILVPVIAYVFFLYFLPTILEINENNKNT